MIPVDELVEYCKADDADYDRIEKLRDAAIAFVNEPGGRYFGATAEITENIIWRGGTFALANEPQGAVTFTRWDGSTWAEVDSTGFIIDGRLVYGYGLSSVNRTGDVHLRATYDAGYEEGFDGEYAAPEDIKQWVRMQVAFWYRHPEGESELGEDHRAALDAILRKYR